MAAYAALVSVMQILDQLQVSSPPPISIDKTQLQFLTQKLAFLQEFLEAYSSHVGYTEEADPMASRIAAAAYAAEDVIESHIVDRILARSTNHGEGVEISSMEFYQSLQTVIEQMELIEVEAVEIKEKKGVRDQLHMIKSATHAGSSVRVAPKSPITVGIDDVLCQMLDKIAGEQLNRQIIPIVGMGGIGSEWETLEGQFCSLKFLLIDGCGLEQWVTDNTHFPRLQHLVLRNMRGLREIPSSMGDIPTLRSIESAVDSAKRIKEEQEDYGNTDLKLIIIPRVFD